MSRVEQLNICMSHMFSRLHYNCRTFLKKLLSFFYNLKQLTLLWVNDFCCMNELANYYMFFIRIAKINFN